MVRQRNKAVLFLLCLLFISSSIFGQVFPFYNYSTDQGLLQSSIFCLYQDHSNYLWAGTDGSGAVRFNGTDFQSFDSRDGLPGNIVRSIYQDSRGLIWFGTDNGIAYYNGKQILQLPDSLSLRDKTILDIEEDSSNNLWLASNNSGVYCLHYTQDLPDKLLNLNKKDGGLLSNFVMDIEIDSLNQVWLAMYGGINIVSLDSSGFKTQSLEQGFEIPAMFVLSLHIDKKGVVWCGSYDAGAFKIESLTNYRNVKAIPIPEVNNLSKRIWKVSSASDNTIWFGTDNNGVIKYDGDNFYHYAQKNGLIGNQFLDIISDVEGIMWFASMTDGISKFYGDYFKLYSDYKTTDDISVTAIAKTEGNLLVGSKTGLSYLTFNKNKITVENTDLSSYSITSLLTHNQTIWVGTKENGVCRIDPRGNKEFITVDNGLPDNYINCISVDQKDRVWLGTKAGVCHLGDSIYVFDKSDGLIDNEVQDILIDSKNGVWMATLGGLAYLNLELLKGATYYRDFDSEEGLDFKKIHCIEEDTKGHIWIGTYGGGVYVYSKGLPDSLLIRNVLSVPDILSNNIYSLSCIDSKTLLVVSDLGINKVVFNDSLEIIESKNYSEQNGFIGNKNLLNSLLIDSSKVWLGTSEGLLLYLPEAEPIVVSKPSISINKIQLFNEDVDWSTRVDSLDRNGLPYRLDLKHNENHISFSYEGVSFRNPDKLYYQYMLEGVDKGWSLKTQQKRISYSGLSDGDYVFIVKYIDDEQGVEQSISIPISIKPPFYKTIVFYLIVALLIAFLTIAYNRFKTAKLRRDKKELTRLVAERTFEIQSQKDKIEGQKEEIEDQKKELTDSILYAEKIQMALLPDVTLLNNTIDNFLFFKPKDIVSGDFYWFGFKEGVDFVCIADCTGHGVPGAFMSMLGVRFLNEIVLEQNVVQPNDILNLLRKKVIQSLHQEKQSSENKDGMDISICAIDRKAKKIQFSGANNSIYHFHNDELLEYKADRMPVSIHPKMDKFSLKETSYEAGDCIYLYSDGFIDQFGGEEGKKFKRGAFKRLLNSIALEDTKKQHQILSNTFTEWIGSYEQIDDVSVMGIKL